MRQARQQIAVGLFCPNAPTAVIKKQQIYLHITKRLRCFVMQKP